MAVKDYNTDPDLNTTISGINIAEGCPPSGINDAIRQLMADVKEEAEAQAVKDATTNSNLATTNSNLATTNSNLATTNSNLATTNSNLATLDAAAVHKTGDETIAGTKTFTGSVIVGDDNNTITIDNGVPYGYQNKNLAKGASPSSNQYCYTAWFGNQSTATSNRIAMNEMMARANGEVVNALCAFKNSTTENVQARLAVVYPLTGSPYATAPSTPADSTGAQIVTADFLQKNQTMAGTKTFEDQVVFFDDPWIQDTTMDIPSWVSGTNNKYLYHVDKNKAPISAIQFRMTPTANAIRFLMRKPGDNTSTFSSAVVLWAQTNNDGVRTAGCVTPPADSNTTHIATTEWVRQFIPYVVTGSAQGGATVTMPTGVTTDYFYVTILPSIRQQTVDDDDTPKCWFDGFTSTTTFTCTCKTSQRGNGYYNYLLIAIKK